MSESSEQSVQTDREIQQSKNMQTVASACAGLIGSSVGKIILHPIDTVKAKLQVQKQASV